MEPIEWVLAGSYRRLAPHSGDVDLLIKKTDDITLSFVLSLLKTIIVAKLDEGITKFMGIMRIDDHVAHRIDIRLIDPSSWAYGLFYFTGSKNFNQYARRQAIKLGMTLNEYGLYKGFDSTSLYAKTERDIFKHLQLSYLDPQDRI